MGSCWSKTDHVPIQDVAFVRPVAVDQDAVDQDEVDDADLWKLLASDDTVLARSIPSLPSVPPPSIDTGSSGNALPPH